MWGDSNKPYQRKYGFFFWPQFSNYFNTISHRKTCQRATTDGINKDPGKGCEESQVFLPYLKANKLPGHHFIGFSRRGRELLSEEFSTQKLCESHEFAFSSCATGPRGLCAGSPGGTEQHSLWWLSPAVSSLGIHDSTIQLEKSKQGQNPWASQISLRII